MSGKRILDAMALLNVSRNILAKHFEIRLAQVDTYARTSSVLKAARSRGPSAFAGASQPFSQSVANAANSQSGDVPIPDQGTAAATNSSRREGVNQDHFYKRSEQNASSDPPPESELEIEQKQAQRYPLPDGTIPPRHSLVGADDGAVDSYSRRPVAEPGQDPTGNDGDALKVKSSGRSTIPEPALQKPLSPQEAREAQRQSEYQIPAKSADPPEDDLPEFSIEQEQDVFYQPPSQSSPVLSALPRMRVPKIENDVQSGDSHIPPGMNADVYYSGDGAKDQEPTEDELTQIFSSPRIAKMLGNKSKYVPGRVQGKAFHTATSARQQSAEAEKKEIEQIAAEVARDAQSSSVSLPASCQILVADELTAS